MTAEFNECSVHEAMCHCVLPEGHDGPHECVADPVCGGKWWRHPDDEPEMLRVYRFPSNRPGCEAYDRTREYNLLPDPPDGEFVLVHEPTDPPVYRMPRGGIRYPSPPDVSSPVIDGDTHPDPVVRDLYALIRGVEFQRWREWAKAEQRRLEQAMRSPDA